MKKYILPLSFVLMILNTSYLYSQNYKRGNTWYFGQYLGLDFNTSPPSVLTNSAMFSGEGVSVLSDTNGQILLYSDGTRLWNKNHQLVPGATNLGGNISTTQSSIIIPKPKALDSIYVFTLDDFSANNGLMYSIVDMKLNGGLGGLVSTNNALLYPSTERLVAIPHCNGIDYWLIAHEASSTNFYIWKISSAGISAPTIISIGSYQIGQTAGYLKGAPDGSKIAMVATANNHIDVIDFDNATGTLSNAIVLTAPQAINLYGVEFSPNSQLIYATSHVGTTHILYQFNLNLPTTQQIQNSGINLLSSVTSYNFGMSSLQLAPNGKIYITRYNQLHLSTIHNPNVSGSNCNFVMNDLYMGGNMLTDGLPNLVPSFILPHVNGANSNINLNLFSNLDSCSQTGYVNTYFNPQGDSTIIEWYKDNQLLTGEDSTSLFVDASGIYSIKMTFLFNCDSSSLTCTKSLPVLFSGDTTFVSTTTCDTAQAGMFTIVFADQYSCDSIVVNTVTLLPSDTTYLFNTTCDSLQVGTFVTVLTNQYGCDSTIVNIVTFLPSSNTFLSNTTCDSTQVGIFTTILTNQYGCDSTITHIVTLEILDTLILPQEICQGSSIIIFGQSVSTSGLYCQTYTSSFGCDSIVCINLVLNSSSISIELNSEPVECKGESNGQAMVDVNHSSAFSIDWSTGSTQSIIQNLAAGWYTITVTDNNGCFVVDSVEVLEPNEVLSLDISIEDISCFGKKDGFIKMNGQGGTAPYQYKIGTNSFSNINQIRGLASGNYNLSVQDAKKCLYDKDVYIEEPLALIIDLGNDINIDLNEKTVITPYISNAKPPINYSWLPQINPNWCFDCPLLEVKDLQNSQLFSLSIIDSLGCEGIDYIWVNVNKNQTVYVATGFSPNGDGVNDFLFVQSDNEVEKVLVFEVYDRWGELVFQTKDIESNHPNLGWNGLSKNLKSPQGVYAWMIEVQFTDDTIKKFFGNTTLVR